MSDTPCLPAEQKKTKLTVKTNQSQSSASASSSSLSASTASAASASSSAGTAGVTDTSITIKTESPTTNYVWKHLAPAGSQKRKLRDEEYLCQTFDGAKMHCFFGDVNRMPPPGKGANLFFVVWSLRPLPTLRYKLSPCKRRKPSHVCLCMPKCTSVAHLLCMCPYVLAFLAFTDV